MVNQSFTFQCQLFVPFATLYPMIPIVNFDSNLFVFYGEDDDTAKVSLVVVVGVSVGSSGYDMVQSYFLYVVSFCGF